MNTGNPYGNEADRITIVFGILAAIAVTGTIFPVVEYVMNVLVITAVVLVVLGLIGYAIYAGTDLFLHIDDDATATEQPSVTTTGARR